MNEWEQECKKLDSSSLDPNDDEIHQRNKILNYESLDENTTDE